ncbi:MAG: hypothetical protein R3E83_05790 [Burkholderiaceae bacterium]
MKIALRRSAFDFFVFLLGIPASLAARLARCFVRAAALRLREAAAMAQAGLCRTRHAIAPTGRPVRNLLLTIGAPVGLFPMFVQRPNAPPALSKAESMVSI